MFFPGVRRRSVSFPHAAIPFLLAVGAIAATIAGWALFAASNAGNEPLAPLPHDVSAIKSVAYTLPGTVSDDIVVQPMSSSTAPRVIASFPSGGPAWPHARGAASPSGEQIAVLWLPLFATRANLAIVDVPTGNVRSVAGAFDYFSRVAWSPDAARLAVTATSESEGGELTSIVEVDLALLRASTTSEFLDAVEVAPVGYSFDSSRLFAVVVDQTGSNLHAVQDGKTTLVAELSPGRTRSWALSPDGSRLAFIDILGGGSRTYIGRTLLIATGAITTMPSQKNQVGVTWLPGSPLPAFGGPGGSVQLTDPAAAGQYLVPAGWSPDGSYLAARVHSGGSAVPAEAGPSLELISRETATTPSTRRTISDNPRAEFLGFVRDLD